VSLTFFSTSPEPEPEGMTGTPVEIVITQDHPYAKKPNDPETGRKRIGCETCNRAKLHPDHLGAPPSMNEGGGGGAMDWRKYQGIKKAWMAVLAAKLAEECAGERWHAVTVECRIGFPTRTKRDEGNVRWMVEKALGDALVVGGWLEDDCIFPVRRYSFGGVEAVHTPGASSVRLILFPTLAPVA
jgi:hypothetical protein